MGAASNLSVFFQVVPEYIGYCTYNSLVTAAQVQSGVDWFKIHFPMVRFFKQNDFLARSDVTTSR